MPVNRPEWSFALASSCIVGVRTRMTGNIIRIFCTTSRWVFRAVIALNFVHFALSFVPGFEATAGNPGIADKIFGELIIGTFRADFAWLIVSTIVIFASTFYLAKI